MVLFFTFFVQSCRFTGNRLVGFCNFFIQLVHFIGKLFTTVLNFCQFILVLVYLVFNFISPFLFCIKLILSFLKGSFFAGQLSVQNINLILGRRNLFLHLNFVELKFTQCVFVFINLCRKVFILTLKTGNLFV